MKRLLTTLFLISILLFSATYTYSATSYMNSSGLQTTSATIIHRAGYCHGIAVASDGTNTVTINVYDNALGTATGTRLIPPWIIPSSATSRTHTYNLYPPVRVLNGITVIMTVAGGGTASYIVYY